ncbi:hypothetical protein LOAG_00335 [Loa loa]|uniref:Auxin_canalis domain-containing protein n=1 Tax=Loa loa TaxID=7209 RepID=A0A1I7VKI3_LOALO|nr:hypothetical protein LOAG_00335 [Loa loa]EFO28155.1 hypothetical protein LOAG_00335 [Loa loa]
MGEVCEGTITVKIKVNKKEQERAAATATAAARECMESKTRSVAPHSHWPSLLYWLHSTIDTARVGTLAPGVLVASASAAAAAGAKPLVGH